MFFLVLHETNFSARAEPPTSGPGCGNGVSHPNIPNPLFIFLMLTKTTTRPWPGEAAPLKPFNGSTGHAMIGSPQVRQWEEDPIIGSTLRWLIGKFGGSFLLFSLHRSHCFYSLNFKGASTKKLKVRLLIVFVAIL